MAQIILIAAMAENRVIGRDNKLIWHIPSDLRHFKQLTLGQIVVMGRRTFESIGRPLPKRTNVVITRSPHFQPEGVHVFHSLFEALEAFRKSDRIYIAGGADIYRQALPIADLMELTIVHRMYAGDAYFPEWNPSEWETVQTTHTTDTDGTQLVSLSFVTLRRVKKDEKYSYRG
ncbi:dihydrofolate reductase [Thermaurantimonas aggregans]|uniref:Dihydrofolate reductase n=1 Tax=Thermaurantimonas aggregans TaxID=2173829 RepID=A0A401XMU7_9FLAO|nr:dihydrofolate reductase [Thermaurantimonas aggregans]MCX8148108.1 dihydrofolate reductase [Thermaurantimonas aggregans]GCD78334.1 dihydrofolate reductase [Thermaurantimonas aggregans]